MTAKGREFDSRPSSALPLEESSLRPATDPSCISATDGKFDSAETEVLSDRRSE